MEIMKESNPNKKSDKMPNGIYYRLLTEIAPRIYCTILARGFELNKKFFEATGVNPHNNDYKEQLSRFAVDHAKILINEIYENRFNND